MVATAAKPSSLVCCARVRTVTCDSPRVAELQFHYIQADLSARWGRKFQSLCGQAWVALVRLCGVRLVPPAATLSQRHEHAATHFNQGPLLCHNYEVWGGNIVTGRATRFTTRKPCSCKVHFQTCCRNVCFPIGYLETIVLKVLLKHPVTHCLLIS
jgi:hypothetical protein